MLSSLSPVDSSQSHPGHDISCRDLKLTTCRLSIAELFFHVHDKFELLTSQTNFCTSMTLLDSDTTNLGISLSTPTTCRFLSDHKEDHFCPTVYRRTLNPTYHLAATQLVVVLESLYPTQHKTSELQFSDTIQEYHTRYHWNMVNFFCSTVPDGNEAALFYSLAEGLWPRPCTLTKAITFDIARRQPFGSRSTRSTSQFSLKFSVGADTVIA